ncbi:MULTISPECIES: CAP domain-containing protein [unclassified Streptomyces]|uniref:CAP domain-containing protein n=1 Tax=unclassified Streptomyces TaxID=2593676 RepID=UPI0033A85709
MGRHRRSAAGAAATGRATGVTDTHRVHTESYGPENLYGYAAVADLPQNAAARSHRKKKAGAPVRTGLLGVSAAVALGTVAVAAGVLPGSDNYSVGGGNASDKVQAADSPSGLETEQGGSTAAAEDREDTGTSRDAQRSVSPSAAPSKTAEKPSATPSEKPSEKPGKSQATKKPGQAATKAPRKPAPANVSAETAAETAVLKLVNEERAKVGCSPVAANSGLSELAAAFSEDMATRGFFDHTDPSGASPWDRAAKAGITDLGGENIARGQATAEAVMEAWMNSPGHRANILNCDFKTLGVGAHFGSGGPWWTQDFGY